MNFKREIKSWFDDPEWIKTDIADAKAQLELLEIKVAELTESIRVAKLHIDYQEQRLKTMASRFSD